MKKKRWTALAISFMLAITGVPVESLVYAADDKVSTMDGNKGNADITLAADVAGPVISDVKTSDVSSSGFTISCKVSGENVGISAVRFMVYRKDIDESKPVGVSTSTEGILKSGRWTAKINASDYGYVLGDFHIDIYAWDLYNDQTIYTLTTNISHEHEWEVRGYYSDPTCTSDGIAICSCRYGDYDNYWMQVPAWGHRWDAGTVGRKATCTETGYRVYKCTNTGRHFACDEEKYENIPATGHGKTALKNVKQATTTAQGYTGDTYCTVCGKTISTGKTIPKLTATPTPKPTATPTPTSTPGLPVGTKVVSNNNGNRFEIKKGRTAAFIGTKKPNTKSIVIPDTLRIQGVTCKVTEISSNALKNNKKITKITMGKNVSVIGGNAFYGCKNLSSITLRTTKLTYKTTGANAFKGIRSNAAVYVPKAKKTAYKKLLRSRGLSTAARIK